MCSCRKVEKQTHLNLSDERYTRPGWMRDGSVLAMSLRLTPPRLLLGLPSSTRSDLVWAGIAYASWPDGLNAS